MMKEGISTSSSWDYKEVNNWTTDTTGNGRKYKGNRKMSQKSDNGGERKI